MPQERSPQPQKRTETRAHQEQARSSMNGKSLVAATGWAVIFGVGLNQAGVEPFSLSNQETEKTSHEMNGADVEADNAQYLKLQGISDMRKEGENLIVTTTRSSTRKIETIPPQEGHPYTTLRFDTSDLEEFFPENRAPGGMFSDWLGKEKVGKERVVAPSELLEKVLRKASRDNPEIERVIQETFNSEKMVAYFTEAAKEDGQIATLLQSAKDPEAKAALYYEIRLRHSNVSEGGGRGSGIYRTSLEEMKTSFNTLRHLMYPGAEHKEQIQEHYKLSDDQYALLLKLVDHISYDEIGALPLTEMMPGNNWERNVRTLNKLSDVFGGEFLTLLPTLSGTEKRPSSALSIYQNTEGNAFTATKFLRDTLMPEMYRAPDSHAEILAEDTNSLMMEVAVAYLDKLVHLIDLIKTAGDERVALLLDPKNKETFAQTLGALHYLPTPVKTQYFPEWADEKLKDPSMTRTLVDFIPRPGSENQNAGPLQHLAEYAYRNGKHAQELGVYSEHIKYAKR